MQRACALFVGTGQAGGVVAAWVDGRRALGMRRMPVALPVALPLRWCEGGISGDSANLGISRAMAIQHKARQSRQGWGGV